MCKKQIIVPPGIMSKREWAQQRVINLLDVLSSYAASECYEELTDIMVPWARELHQMLQEQKDIRFINSKKEGK